ncbi:universal stress protein (plasmid) [Leisingera sp. M527]|uniref:universal stress protein n=1 Tax=Leisingera sp. M527 TaxID=2867014 RepID=UPI0021A2D624|nr:universal stress protein [Leisingera sp. M527]UWQ35656.1 universal stress protein [Leisingera sp. M527]
MQHRTSLFVLSKNTSDTAITRAAEAAREQKAHLACLLLDALPGQPGFAFGASDYRALVVPSDWLELLQKTREAAEARAAEVEALLARSNCAGDVQYSVCPIAEIKRIAARRASTCDIAEAATGLRESGKVFREAVHGVLFRSPIGIMTNGTPFALHDRIFLAWNSGYAASCAAHAALSYFLTSKEVVIGCFDPDMTGGRDGEDPGTDVAAWLSHHGCNVTVSQYPTGGQEVGRCIQDRAREAGAGLVVMGAYGQSRMREAVFGGTTRTMIEQTDIPVLFAH